MRALALAVMLLLSACGQPQAAKPKAWPAPAVTASSPAADPATAAQAPQPIPIPPIQVDMSSPEERAKTTAAVTKRVKVLLSLDDPAFDQHPASLLTGRLAAARPVGEDRMFVTRISEDAATAGVNFAGHNTIVRVGCGTGCSLSWVVDRRTGVVRSLGLGGEEQAMVELVFKPGSRLIKAGWEEDGKCHYQSFVWSGERLEPAGDVVLFSREQLEGYCPRSDD